MEKSSFRKTTKRRKMMGRRFWGFINAMSALVGIWLITGSPMIYFGETGLLFVPRVFLAILSLSGGLLLCLGSLNSKGWRIFNLYKIRSFSKTSQSKPTKSTDPWKINPPKFQVKKEEEKPIPKIWKEKVLAGG